MIALTSVGEMIDIADKGENTTSRDRLRVQTRKAVAERLAPDVFGPPKTDNLSGMGGALSEIFKAVSNAGHKLPKEIHEGEFTEIEDGT